jgi:hypothetical protein
MELKQPKPSDTQETSVALGNLGALNSITGG